MENMKTDEFHANLTQWTSSATTTADKRLDLAKHDCSFKILLNKYNKLSTRTWILAAHTYTNTLILDWYVSLAAERISFSVLVYVKETGSGRECEI